MYLKIKIFNIDMAKLAIKGHPKRGKEVIEILEMLGGENNDCSGKDIYAVYAITNNGYIYPYQHSYKRYPDDFRIFTLEEFLEKFPYKVGDKVIIKSKNQEAIIDKVIWCCDTITYWLKYDGFIEGNWRVEHLQPYKEEIMEENNEKSANHVFDTEVITFDIAQRDKYELDLQGKFQVVLREGKYYVERIKPQYPKTYEECCKVLGYSGNYNMILTTDVDNKLFDALYRLKVCRDAYWKIYGERMGLGKPWEPDWKNPSERKYCIVNTEGDITKWIQKTTNKILAFPTAEIRDAYKENFDNDIEICKEFL